jgi:hypothetical protein
MDAPIRESPKQLTLYFKNARDLEDEIRKTPMGTIVEVEFRPDKGQTKPVHSLGYYNGITNDYRADSRGVNRRYRMIELLLSGKKAAQHIALTALYTFTRHDPKTAYALVQTQDVPPSHHPKHNLKAERF